MPERILHIVHTMNRSGMESRIMDLYRNIDHEKYQFDFYVESGKADAYDDEIKSLGGKMYYTNGVNRLNIPSFSSFEQFLSDHQEYKIIYAYNQWAGFYLRVAKKYSVPFRIAYSRTSIQTKSLKNLVKNVVKLSTNKYASHRFAVSKKAAIWLFGKRAVDNGLVNIWPNAIDAKKFAFSSDVRKDVRSELGIKDEYVVMHVGNIRPEKNHAFLLRIFKEIKKEVSKSRLVLVGRGGMDSIRQEIEILQLEDSILYLGIRSDVPRLLQAADVFVFPSFYEGFPGAVLEAQASGLNCLMSDSITDEVMITDHVRTLPITVNPEIWAKTILSFNQNDRENAWIRIKAAHYDINDLVIETEKFLKSLAHR